MPLAECVASGCFPLPRSLVAEGPAGSHRELASVAWLSVRNFWSRLSCSCCLGRGCLAVSVLLLTSQIATRPLANTRLKLTLECRTKLCISRSNTAGVEWHRSVGTGHAYHQLQGWHEGRLLLENSSPALVCQWPTAPAQSALTGCVALTRRALLCTGECSPRPGSD